MLAVGGNEAIMLLTQCNRRGAELSERELREDEEEAVGERVAAGASGGFRGRL
jgi:hypothetical protein